MLADRAQPEIVPAVGLPGRLIEHPVNIDEESLGLDLLKQAGFDAPPATWEELLTQAKVLKDQGIVEYPIVWSWGQAGARYFVSPTVALVARLGLGNFNYYALELGADFRF